MDHLRATEAHTAFKFEASRPRPLEYFIIKVGLCESSMCGSGAEQLVAKSSNPSFESSLQILLSSYYSDFESSSLSSLLLVVIVIVVVVVVVIVVVTSSLDNIGYVDAGPATITATTTRTRTVTRTAVTATIVSRLKRRNVLWLESVHVYLIDNDSLPDIWV